jgi:hypothetical protein
MKKICLQSGHWNKPGGGAPNEQATNKRITDRLAYLLRQRGFEVYQTDWAGDTDPKVTKVDYDLFLALHCDMDYPGDNGSGFADYCDPASDGNTKESQRICKIINDNYFPDVKINYVNHSNDNTRFYYMWKSLTSKTPCVLLEMGQSIDPHDSVLLANTDLIANAIGRCICKAFDVPFDLSPVTPPTDCAKLLADKDEQIRNLGTQKAFLESDKVVLTQKVVQLEADLSTKTALVADWQKQTKTANAQVKDLTEQLGIKTTDASKYRKLYEGYNNLSGWGLIKLGISKLQVKK